MYARFNGTSIDIYGSLPRRWANTLNFPAATQEEREFYGFYDYVIPVYDEATQRLGPTYFNGTIYTHDVFNLSTEEIDDKAEEQGIADALFVEQQLYDTGNFILLRHKAYLRYLLTDGQITEPQFDAEKIEMNKIYNDLNIGEFVEAKAALIALVASVVPEIQARRVVLQAEIQNELDNL